jgi:hypothetical protein
MKEANIRFMGGLFNTANTSTMSRNNKILRTLRTRTEMDLETSVFSYFNHLTRLVAREDFIVIVLLINS